MPDICDRANEEMMFLENLRKQNYKTPQKPSATVCENCSAPIDEKRQRLIPGVQTCPDCQNMEEAVARNSRRMYMNAPGRYR